MCRPTRRAQCASRRHALNHGRFKSCFGISAHGRFPGRGSNALRCQAKISTESSRPPYQQKSRRFLQANTDCVEPAVFRAYTWTLSVGDFVGEFQRLSKDLREIAILAGPILAQYVVAHSSQLIDTSFVAHLDQPALLSSVVLANSLAMVTGYYIVMGLAAASETLSGQAHGAGNSTALGLTLQRSLAVCSAAAAPISALWWNAEPILTSLGQAPEIAAGAARYLQLTLPALYSFLVFRCVDRHLLAQGIVAPGLAIATLATAMTPAYCWFFMCHLGLQLEGAAYAYCCTQATATALSLTYLTWRSRSTLGQSGAVPLAPSAAALTGWRPYLELAVPATLMSCMEGWAVEVLIFLSGNLDHPEVAVGVTGLCMQFSTLVWLSAASISSATCTRIAISLGKGDAAGAQRLAYSSLGLVLLSQTLIGLAAYGASDQLVGLMTTEQEVLALTRQVMPVLAVCFIFDGQNVVLSSVLRGAGRQWFGAGCNLVGWWLVGIPLAYSLGLQVGMGVQGIWTGFTTASGLQACVQWIVVAQMDWEAEVRRAGEMVLSSCGAGIGPEPSAGGSSSSGGAWAGTCTSPCASPQDADAQEASGEREVSIGQTDRRGA
ncbi:hypothetical protein VaNZ11_000687 [Volvox africanus]|uniref:Protein DETOXIFICATION n=1 Tax=Volvox africanus TaxID=51714 RepID=A0ABQ5RMX0_9CHLO|nr:hypothetical protein VaNZ11_000687 [Volvox africanus]